MAFDKFFVGNFLFCNYVSQIIAETVWAELKIRAEADLGPKTGLKLGSVHNSGAFNTKAVF